MREGRVEGGWCCFLYCPESQASAYTNLQISLIVEKCVCKMTLKSCSFVFVFVFCMCLGKRDGRKGGGHACMCYYACVHVCMCVPVCLCFCFQKIIVHLQSANHE